MLKVMIIEQICLQIHITNIEICENTNKWMLKAMIIEQICLQIHIKSIEIYEDNNE